MFPNHLPHLGPIIRSLSIALLIVLLYLAGCAGSPSGGGAAPATGAATGDPNSFLVVDCLLPGQLRKLGAMKTYLTARRPIRTTAVDCEIRGGEYVAYDRANYATSLKVWLPLAEQGDALAQIYVGQIFEKGMGVAPDYATAARWYRQAAEQGNSRAQISLGFLYERGLGVNRDPNAALNWYRQAAGMPDVITLDTQAVAETPAPVAAPAPPPKAPDRVDALPQIELIEPPLKPTRSLDTPTVKTRSNQSRPIVGRVIAPTGIARLLLNNQSITADASGLFRTEIQVANSNQPVEIVAIDNQGRTGSVRIILIPDSASPATVAETAQTASVAISASVIRQQGIEFGNYHALIIGNKDYLHLPKLDTPVNDANAIASVLSSRYGFNNIVLLNANRYQILSALNQMREKLTEKDNLLLYYAGHGTLDPVNLRGYWQPVDAEANNTANWISTFDITDMLNIMNAREVLVIADSCYSGAMTLSSIPNISVGLSEEKRIQAIQQITTKRSRTALTSGGLAPVLDSDGDGRHSIFNKVLIDFLENSRGVVEGLRLYENVGQKVALQASRLQFEQVPQYAAINNAGHEAGDFFFVPQ